MQQILDVVFAAVEVLAPGPEISSRIGPIALSEEPRRDSRIVRRVIRSILLQRVIRRVDCI